MMGISQYVIVEMDSQNLLNTICWGIIAHKVHLFVTHTRVIQLPGHTHLSVCTDIAW